MRASAQIRLHNWAKANTFLPFPPVVKTNGNEHFVFSNSFQNISKLIIKRYTIKFDTIIGNPGAGHINI